MTAQDEKYDIQFYQLILSMQSAAWYQLGKVASPFSGKIERDLQQAKHSIDMLEMIQRKTKGNLSDEEHKLLDHVLYELRLNYVEEVKKPDTEQQKEAEAATPEEESSGTQPAEESNGKSQTGDGADSAGDK